jgi:hypothetical protein
MDRLISVQCRAPPLLSLDGAHNGLQGALPIGTQTFTFRDSARMSQGPARVDSAENRRPLQGLSCSVGSHQHFPHISTAAKRSSPCRMRYKAHLCRRSRRPCCAVQCRVGISGRCTLLVPERSRTADRYKRKAYDETPERFPAGSRRRPGTPIARFQSACS